MDIFSFDPLELVWELVQPINGSVNVPTDLLGFGLAAVADNEKSFSLWVFGGSSYNGIQSLTASRLHPFC